MGTEDIYKSAEFIIQVSGFCNKKCEGCYLKNFFPEILDKSIYLFHISSLFPGDLISIRGGELTLVVGWFDRFVQPAIDKGLKVIIETNGYFIGRSNYYEILPRLAHDNIFLRISFDKEHAPNSNKEEFFKMSLFAQDAQKIGIKFGFYSLGMNDDQILEFIENTALESYLEFFHPLTKYDDISQIKLKGRYLRADGKIFDNIVE